MTKIFMIDDNPLEHLTTGKMLDKYVNQLEISHSLDPALALRILEKNKLNVAALPDLILLDLNMPDFSGLNFLESFQELDNQFIKKIIIVILTSSVDSKDQAFCAKFSFVSSYFVKPITQHIIQQIFPL